MIPTIRKVHAPLKRFFSNSLNKFEVDDQTINRHRTDVAVHDFYPTAINSRFISPSSVLVGETVMETHSFVGDFSVLKGDLNLVKLEKNAIVMENCVLATVSELDKTGQRAWTYLLPDAMVMPGASVISAELDNGVTIGPRSIVCEGARIGEYSMIGANSVVPPYRYIPANQLWAGNPVRFVKDLSKQEITSMRVFKDTYRSIKVEEAKDFALRSSAFIEKEILDDLEIELKKEEITLKDLEHALDLMQANGLEIFFAKELVTLARKRFEELKSKEVVSQKFPSS